MYLKSHVSDKTLTTGQSMSPVSYRGIVYNIEMPLFSYSNLNPHQRAIPNTGTTFGLVQMVTRSIVITLSSSIFF